LLYEPKAYGIGVTLRLVGDPGGVVSGIVVVEVDVMVYETSVEQALSFKAIS
jgi:hypothetical protein